MDDRNLKFYGWRRVQDIEQWERVGCWQYGYSDVEPCNRGYIECNPDSGMELPNEWWRPMRDNGTLFSNEIYNWSSSESDVDTNDIDSNDILLEAYRLTTGDRQNKYGPPDQDFARIAPMWSALKGIRFEPREVAMFLICVKLSRETHQRQRDNWVDIAGYARCGNICREVAEGVYEPAGSDMGVSASVGQGLPEVDPA